MSKSKQLYAQSNKLYEEAQELDRRERLEATHKRLDAIKERVARLTLHAQNGAAQHCKEFEEWLDQVEKHG